MEDIVIIGAGIGGLATALALHRLGLKSMVLESADALRASGFAISMWSNAWKALDTLGVGDSLRKQHKQILKMVWISTNSGVPISNTSLTSKGECGYHEARFLERKVLLQAMAKELPNDAIRYSTKVVSIEDLGHLKKLHLADGSTLKTKVLIGGDGINSVVARWLGFKKPWFDGRYAIRGIAHFDRSQAFQPTFLQCIGNGVRFGIVPCDDTSIYWFYIWTPSQKEKGMKDKQVKMKQFVLENLKRVPNWVPAVVEKTDMEDILFSPLSLRSPWELLWGDISKGNVCVVGDALHPMTPDLGQGGCSALEDAIVLARCIGKALSKRNTSTNKSDDQEEYAQMKIALSKYSHKRRWRITELTTTAYVVGSIQQSNGKLISLMREHVLASYLAEVMVKRGDYDCGQLRE